MTQLSLDMSFAVLFFNPATMSVVGRHDTPAYEQVILFVSRRGTGKPNTDFILAVALVRPW